VSLKRCEAPECGREFEPQRSTAKFCNATCRQRAARARKAAEVSVEADAAAGKADHPLVRAVRKELADADVEKSFNGQLALQLAHKLTDPTEKAATALSKELRTVMAAALEGRSAEPAAEDADDEPAEPDDEVTKARRAREEARKAAGLA
jgi:hypothetical protein